MPYYPPASAGSGGGYNLIEDEGTPQTARTTINFVGAGVTASDVAGETQVSIAGGGSPSSTTVEVDLGATPVWQGKFTITDAAINTSSKVLVWQAPGPYTGKGTLADEASLDRIVCVAEPLTGTATVHWRTVHTLAHISDQESSGTNANTAANANSGTVRNIEATRYAKIIGKVRGNVKFTYLVLS